MSTTFEKYVRYQFARVATFIEDDKCLDTGEDFPEITEAVVYARSFAEVLVTLLQALPTPVIPASLHQRCVLQTERDEALEVRSIRALVHDDLLIRSLKDAALWSGRCDTKRNVLSLYARGTPNNIDTGLADVDCIPCMSYPTQRRQGNRRRHNVGNTRFVF